MPYICVENPSGAVGRRFVWYTEHDRVSWGEAVGRALQTISGGHEALTIRRRSVDTPTSDGLNTPTWCIQPSGPASQALPTKTPTSDRL